jgi:hypothetical protein
MVVGQATADHDPVMAIRAGMDPGPVTAAVDLAAIMAGMAARGRAPVINPDDHPEEVAAVAVHALAGTAIPVAAVAAVDINKVRAQVARAAATCARTAISVTAAMVGQAAAIANC